MAYEFNKSNSESFTLANALVTGTPSTFATRCYSYTPGSGNQGLISVGHTSTPNRFLSVFIGSGAGNVFVRHRNGATTGQAWTSTPLSGSFPDPAWYHVCAVFASDSSRTVYINGGSSGSDATAVPAFTPNVTGFGCLEYVVTTDYLDGGMADVAIYNAALTAPEVASLAAKVSPRMVRPGSLVAYYPMVGHPRQPWVGDQFLTGAFVPAQIKPHPRIIGPAAPRAGVGGAVWPYGGGSFDRGIARGVARGVA